MQLHEQLCQPSLRAYVHSSEVSTFSQIPLVDLFTTLKMMGGKFNLSVKTTVRPNEVSRGFDPNDPPQLLVTDAVIMPRADDLLIVGNARYVFVLTQGNMEESVGDNGALNGILVTNFSWPDLFMLRNKVVAKISDIQIQLI